MTKPIPTEIDTDINSEVLASLKGASCHSDIIIPIQKCLSEYKNIRCYYPDDEKFGYICWYVNGIIFAYATGMQKVSIRLAQEGNLDINKLEPSNNYHKCNSWYSIPYNSTNLDLLVKSAYESAKNS